MAQQTEKKVKLQPIGYRVIAERLEQEQALKGGIILPDSAKKKQEKLRVVAVGKGKLAQDGTLIVCPVNVGDIILMDKYAGQEVSFDDEEYVIVNGDDIVAVIEN